MLTSSAPFRTGNALATTFTGTRSERFGDPVEWIPTPQRLLDWLDVNGLAVAACDATELERARLLREAIDVVLTDVARGEPATAEAVAVLNECSTGGNAGAVLTSGGGRQWRLGPERRVADALSVVAADAVALAAGERDGRIALCASPTCRAAFLDTSQSKSRRWCDMNTCGNRQKKARLNRRRAAAHGPGDPHRATASERS